jgi:hypothetical protein
MWGISLFCVGLSGCTGSVVLCLVRTPPKLIDRLVKGSAYLLVASILVACLGSTIEHVPSVSDFLRTVRVNLEDCASQLRVLF